MFVYQRVRLNSHCTSGSGPSAVHLGFQSLQHLVREVLPHHFALQILSILRSTRGSNDFSSTKPDLAPEAKRGKTARKTIHNWMATAEAMSFSLDMTKKGCQTLNDMWVS